MTPAQLRMARALLQLGIRELAEKAGVDKMSVQRIESGRRAHPPTMAKIREALVAEGIVFIGAVEPFHAETVAMRWDRRPSSTGEEDQIDDDESEEPEANRDAQSWDAVDVKYGPGQMAKLRSLWSDEGRWGQLSAASQKALMKRLGELPENPPHWSVPEV